MLLRALIWGAITYFIANEFSTSNLWVVVLSVFLFSVPISLVGIYSSTIHQIRRLTLFASHGWLFRLLSGRPLKVIIWIAWAVCTSFFMLVQFHTYSRLEWVTFFLVIPVFWVTFLVFHRLFAAELKQYLVTEMALVWSRRLAPLVMIMIYVVLVGHFGDTIAYSSFREAIDAQKTVMADMTGSDLIREVSRYLAIYDGAKDYVLGRMGPQDLLWALTLLGIGSFVVYYNACTILSSFLIPGKEYRRVFGPLTDSDEVQPVPLLRMTAIAGGITFLALFIYVPMFAYLEAWVQKIPEENGATEIIELGVEQIGDHFFHEGTLAQVQNARVNALHKVDVSIAHLEGSADRAFDRIEGNVDTYLDWYYSLAGEYTRIAALLVGELEEEMRKKLAETLQQGNAFEEFETAFDNTLASHETALGEYEQVAKSIMHRNRVDPAGASFHVVRRMSLEDVLNPPVHQDIIKLKNRLSASGGAGAAAGIVTVVVVNKIVAKVVGKSVIKIAAKALLKVVTSKAVATGGGAAAGALGGAAVGTIVPGIGNVTGAIVGGIIGGVAAGVTVDKLLLMLEESLNRVEFQQEIVSVINEARIEFKAELKGRSASL
ncbi:MAG: hypothetical protein ABFS45_25935 [Pseudomonadota bacterium]